MTEQITPEDADRLADFLNEVCSLTINSLLSRDLTQRLSVAASLRDLTGQFDEGSMVGSFLTVLIDWLEGHRPTMLVVRGLGGPFRRALETMLQEVPDFQAARKSSPDSPEPISRQVLAQLVSAVVAAQAAGNAEVQQKLATQLVNIQMKLSGEWQARLTPLLENLRAVLGGADPRILPEVPDPLYRRFWMSALELLISAELKEGRAHEQLMERLVHNTVFVARAGQAELTEGFVRSLLDVQRQALEAGAPAVATLIGAIRAYLSGMDPYPIVAALDGVELEAWGRIIDQLNGAIKITESSQ